MKIGDWVRLNKALADELGFELGVVVGETDDGWLEVEPGDTPAPEGVCQDSWLVAPDEVEPRR